MRRSTAFSAAGATACVAAGRSLAAGEVDVWRISLDSPDADRLAQLRATLSADEESRAQRFRFERDRWRFVVARGMLRTLLGEYLDCAAAEVAFQYGPNGKPHLAAPERGIHFNVTHSEGLALAAFTRTAPVGIDLERVRALPDWEAIALTCFRPAEVEALRVMPTAAREAEFFRIWTQQEALLKALGTGLGATEYRELRPTAASYRLHAIEVGADFAAAVALPAAAEWANCYTWCPFNLTEDAEIQVFKLDDRGESRMKLL